MFDGQALNDEDRRDWLETLNRLAKKELVKNSCIIACSALKEKYRNILSQEIESKTKWVYLSGTFEQISNRLIKRNNHFMPSNLLKSQFDILEKPNEALQIDISLTPENIIETIKGNNNKFL